MNLIATYISGVRVILIGAYSIDDLYHIGRIDTLGIRLIIIVYFLVVICMVLSYLISCCMTSVASSPGHSQFLMIHAKNEKAWFAKSRAPHLGGRVVEG